MMRKFEVLDHTADVKIKAYGQTLKELFANSLEAMAYVLKPEKNETKGKLIKKTVGVESNDLNSLLVNFLSQVLYQSQVNHILFKEAKFSEFKDNKLRAIILGRSLDEFAQDVKGVTYHGLKIQQNLQGTWQAELIFDV